MILLRGVMLMKKEVNQGLSLLLSLSLAGTLAFWALWRWDNKKLYSQEVKSVVE